SSQSLLSPIRSLACSTQITGTPRLRSSAVKALIGATMPRAAGTSAGAPGVQKAVCMSITISAVRAGSSRSNRWQRPRRCKTRSTISLRTVTECMSWLAVNFREVVHSVRTGNADVAKPQRFAEDRMDTHKNARLTPKGREEMVRAVVDRGMSKAAAARRFNTTPKIVGKWVGRFSADGVDGLRDRSSRPLSSPSQIPLATADAVENLRRERRTQEHIAAEIGISKASVSRILERRGLSRLSSLELQEPHPRYEREKPGEIIHLDIKKLGRFSSVGHRVTGRRTGYFSRQGAGWEFVHVAIDDHSRIARAEIFPDQKKESAVAFLLATVAYFRSLGITVERVMTDNGSCYLSKAFARACKQLAVKHIRIKPY